MIMTKHDGIPVLPYNMGIRIRRVRCTENNQNTGNETLCLSGLATFDFFDVQRLLFSASACLGGYKTPTNLHFFSIFQIDAGRGKVKHFRPFMIFIYKASTPAWIISSPGIPFVVFHAGYIAKQYSHLPSPLQSQFDDIPLTSQSPASPKRTHPCDCARISDKESAALSDFTAQCPVFPFQCPVLLPQCPVLLPQCPVFAPRIKATTQPFDKSDSRNSRDTGLRIPVFFPHPRATHYTWSYCQNSPRSRFQIPHSHIHP